MRAYELMVIISGKLDESTAHAWLKTITNSVTAAGGSIHGNPDWWGKRRLAYPIQKQEEGFYAVFNIVAEAGAMDEVERGFRLSDDVLRHKLLRLPEAEAARRGMVSAA
jgi:small subunit ribosomal protein S6